MIQTFHNHKGKAKLHYYYEDDDEDSYENALVILEDYTFNYKLLPYIL